mgnify:CR=1 FL=1
MWKAVRAWIFRNDSTRCRFCGAKLTGQEIIHYEVTCTKCEHINNEKMRKA